MDKYETTSGVLNIAETCAASISIDDLVALCEDPNVPRPLSTSTKLTYGAIRGSQALRERLASLYSARVSSPLSTDNVLITPGAIAANFLLFYTLIGPSDHVICVHPTYQQLYAVPKSLGAEVSLWTLRKEKKYIPDLEDLKSLVKENTKMIIINNPNSTYQGRSFLPIRNVSRGVPLETLSPFIFSYCICSRDMSREQQLQIPPEEIIANSPLTNRAEKKHK
jgi:hypothetical protein